MSEQELPSEHLKDLIDDYLDRVADDGRVQELEALLSADADLRSYFVRYARLHTDLHLEVRARQGSARALASIERLAQAQSALASPTPAGFLRKALTLKSVVAAACLLLAAAFGWRLVTDNLGTPEAVAWLVNAQNCKWCDDVGSAGNMQAGRILKIERGLAEIQFQCGARVVLEGPARLELLSVKSARLLQGKLTARVPAAATGFEILSPQAKVVDLGTEFGMAVSDDGTTDVFVFDGKVEAQAATGGVQAAVNLAQHQGAQIVGGKVVVHPATPGTGGGQFVRAIVPPPEISTRRFHLKFDQAVEDSLRDSAGLGTGLTHRLPGTGRRLGEHDANLRLDTAKARLELTTTDSDLNTQYKLHRGEYLGVPLSDLGFTGKEDFAATATFLDIPALEFVGQFGLYAGARSDLNIRGGLLSAKKEEPGHYTQFLVNNYKDGCDSDTYKVGLLSTGTDLRLTLKRISGKFALTVDNLTSGGSSTLSIQHPELLDQEPELFLGLFGANTQSNVRKTLLVKDFQVTVWTVSSPPSAVAAP
jgi:hypothetical protein